jgi:LysR family carnitine catabolism transcriptional activator
MNLSQRQLQLFVTTATLGHITRASEALHISQPGLSRALRELESQLDVLLFHRTTRQLSLTEQGQALLPRAQALLREMNAVVASLQTPAQPLQTTVSVALGTAFGCTVMPRAVQWLAQTHPGLRLRLIDDNSGGITLRTARAEVDLGIGSTVGDTGRLRCLKLLSAPIGLLALPGRYALLKHMRLQDLDRLPLLKEPADTSIAQALAARGSDVVAWMSHGTEVSSLAIQLALAQAGQGVAVVSALGASHPGAKGLTFVPLKPAVERSVYLMQHREQSSDAATQAVMAAVRHALREVTLHPRVKRADQV